MKNFYILDEPDLPTPYNHRFFVEKFVSGFSLNGFKVEVVRSTNLIKENSIVMISNHGFLGKPFLGRYLFKKSGQKKAVKVLERISKIKNITVICWFYHDRVDLLEKLGINYILTGEYFYSEPTSPSHKKLYNIYKTSDKALPIKFAAAVDPDKVGENCHNRAIRMCYIGNKSYKPEYYKLFSKRRDCKIVPTPPHIPEEERINIYRNSMISLGLHSPENIQNNVVVERVFESLVYGALCFSDNPAAVKATNGIVKLIKNKNHLLELVEHYVNNEKEMLRLREKGFEFIKTQGTYKHVVRKFIDLASKLYSFKSVRAPNRGSP